MNEKKYLLLFISVTLFLVLGGVWYLGSSSSIQDVKASEDVKAQTVEATSFDWGTIPLNGGNVTKSFTIKNPGIKPLKIFNVRTSCHCTIAHVTIDGKKSENFGMSGVSDWTGEVKPGGDAKVQIIFDPAFHGPQGTGPVTRFVSVETNAKGNEKITFTLTGTVHK